MGTTRFHKFRDAEPTSKHWNLATGDELDVSIYGHSFVVAATLLLMDSLNVCYLCGISCVGANTVKIFDSGAQMSRVKLDTEPLGTNIKNYKFRSSKGARKFAPVAKTQRPLIEYFE